MVDRNNIEEWMLEKAFGKENDSTFEVEIYDKLTLEDCLDAINKIEKNFGLNAVSVKLYLREKYELVTGDDTEDNFNKTGNLSGIYIKIKQIPVLVIKTCRK